MNAKQKKEAQEIVWRLDALESELEALAAEVRDAFDSMSEKGQESKKGQQLEEEATELENAVEALHGASDTIGSYL